MPEWKTAFFIIITIVLGCLIAAAWTAPDVPISGKWEVTGVLFLFYSVPASFCFREDE